MSRCREQKAKYHNITQHLIQRNLHQGSEMNCGMYTTYKDICYLEGHTRSNVLTFV